MSIDYKKPLKCVCDCLIYPISFFTFQQIAYLADAYEGITHEYKFSHYALFVTFLG